MTRIMLDSQVLLDLLIRREPGYAAARRLVVYAAAGEYELWVSSTQLAALVDSVAQGSLKVAEACRGYLLGLHRYVHIISPSERGTASVLASPWSDVDHALVHQAAVELGADAIVANDARGYLLSTMPVMDAGQCMTWLEHTNRLSLAGIEI